MALVTAATLGGTLLGSTFLASAAAFTINVAIGAVASFALSTVTAAIAGKPKSPIPAVRTRVAFGGDVPRSFILGRAATAGSFVWGNTWGQSGKVPNAYLTQVFALSDLPVAGLRKVFVNGEEVTLGATADPDGKGYPVEEYQWKGEPYLWVKFYDGTQTAADPFLVNTASSADRPWQGSRVGVGVAYAVTTARFRAELFQGTPNFRFEIDGIELPDATTLADADERRVDPVSQMLALMKGLTYGGQPFYGCQGFAAAQFPAADWAAAAVKARDAGFEAGGEIEVSTPVGDVIEALLAACQGRICDDAGVSYRPIVGLPGASVASFTDDDIISTSPQSFTPFQGLADTINGVVATYPSPEQGWNARTAPPIYDSALEAEDGGRRLPVALDLPLVHQDAQVQQLMKAALAEARRARRHTLTLPPGYAAIRAGDRIEWSSARNGYAAKDFRVDGVVRQGDLDVMIEITEIDPADYDWDVATDFAPVSDGFLGAARPAEQSTSISVAPHAITVAGVPRRPAILLAWTGAPDDAVSLAWQVRLTATGDVVADGVVDVEPGENGSTIISAGLVGNTAYQVRGLWRVRPSRPVAWSAWLGVVTPDIRLQDVDIGAAVIAANNLKQEVLDLIGGDGAPILVGAEDARDAALAAQILAEQAVIDALAQATAAGNSADDAAAEKVLAEAQRVLAQAAVADAAAQKALAQAAATDSAAAKVLSEAAKVLAEGARDDAQAYLTTTEARATDAANAANSAITQAGIATARADDASASADAATASVIDAESARDATLGALVAQFPTDFKLAQAWSNVATAVTPPSTINPARIVDSEIGPVYEQTGFDDLSPVAYMRVIPGAVYDIEFRVRQAVDNTVVPASGDPEKLVVQAVKYNAGGTVAGYPSLVETPDRAAIFTPMRAADGWVAYGGRYVIPESETAAFWRPRVYNHYNGAGAYGDGTWQVASMRVREATSEVVAENAAAAAVISADSASSSADDAGSSASAASLAKTQAEAARSDASGFASAASSSADTATARATDAGDFATAANAARVDAEIARDDAISSAGVATTKAGEASDDAASALASERAAASLSTGNLVRTPNGNDGIGAWWRSTLTEVVDDRPAGADPTSKSLRTPDANWELPLRAGDIVGRTYRFSAWCRFEPNGAVDAGAYLHFRGRRVGQTGDGNNLGYATSRITSVEWTFVEGVITITGNAVEVWAPGIDIAGPTLADQEVARLVINDYRIEDITQANAAAESAGAASVSKTEAGNFADAASAAKVLAESARDAASGSASAAATSASTASTKATDAGNFADAASAAKVLAESARDAASGSASAAATSAGAASSKATEAENSATAANSAKVAAESARDTSVDSAAAAVVSADTATARATDAGNFADAASASVVTAQAARDLASGYADAAFASAQSATASSTDAETAAGAADIARVAAEVARDATSSLAAGNLIRLARPASATDLGDWVGLATPNTVDEAPPGFTGRSLNVKVFSRERPGYPASALVGRIFRVHAWIKAAPGTTDNLGVILREPTTSTYYNGTSVASIAVPGQDWTETEFLWTIPNTLPGDAAFAFQQTSTGSYYVHDLRIEDVTSVELSAQFAGAAFVSETNAGGSATDAGVAATTATNMRNEAVAVRDEVVATVVANAPPTTPGAGVEFWTETPTANPPALLTSARLVDVAGVGTVHQRTGFDDFGPSALFPATPGAIYEVEARARVTVNSTLTGGSRETTLLHVWTFDEAGASEGSVSLAAVGASSPLRNPHRVADGWVTLRGRFVVPASPSYTQFRPRIYSQWGNTQSDGTATWQVSHMIVRDVSTEVQAESFAAAAAGSASTASTKADDAGNAATAALEARTQAEQARDDASSFATTATNQATSASDNAALAAQYATTIAGLSSNNLLHTNAVSDTGDTGEWAAQSAGGTVFVSSLVPTGVVGHSLGFESDASAVAGNFYEGPWREGNLFSRKLRFRAYARTLDSETPNSRPLNAGVQIERADGSTSIIASLLRSAGQNFALAEAEVVVAENCVRWRPALQIQGPFGGIGRVRLYAPSLADVTTLASVETLAASKVDAAGAIAALDNEVSAQSGGGLATVRALTQAQVTLDGQARALEYVVVEANGRVATRAMGANDTGSSVIYRADRFQVENVLNGTPKAIFTVEDGDVVIDGDFVLKGSSVGFGPIDHAGDAVSSQLLVDYDYGGGGLNRDVWERVASITVPHAAWVQVSVEANVSRTAPGSDWQWRILKGGSVLTSGTADSPVEVSHPSFGNSWVVNQENFRIKASSVGFVEVSAGQAINFDLMEKGDEVGYGIIKMKVFALWR